MEGLIIKNISNDYVVKSNNKEYICKARGKFRKDKTTPLVGDRVIFDENNNYILKIFPRKNYLIRPNVSNIDIALIVTSVKNPNLDTHLLDKLLTIISYNNIKPIICFTKIDLLNKEEKEKISNYIDYYNKIGYQTVTNERIDIFNNLFKNKIVVLTGQSGAGKSSLLNKLDSSLNLKTDEISYALNRGKHTTRHTALYDILDGYIVDTPGFSQVDFNGMTKTDISHNMKDIFDNSHYCKYKDCLHIKEDNCYVKEQLEKGIILKSRYDNYKQFIESIKDIR